MSEQDSRLFYWVFEHYGGEEYRNTARFYTPSDTFNHVAFLQSQHKHPSFTIVEVE